MLFLLTLTYHRQRHPSFLKLGSLWFPNTVRKGQGTELKVGQGGWWKTFYHENLNRVMPQLWTPLLTSFQAQNITQGPACHSSLTQAQLQKSLQSDTFPQARLECHTFAFPSSHPIPSLKSIAAVKLDAMTLISTDLSKSRESTLVSLHLTSICGLLYVPLRTHVHAHTHTHREREGAHNKWVYTN